MAKQKSGRKENGSGSIYFDNGKNKWFAEIRWKDKSGEIHRKRFSDKKQTVVKFKLENFKRQLIISDGNIKNSDVTFKEFSERWMNDILKKQLKPTSYNRKEVTLEHQVYPYIGSTPINQITHTDIQKMVNGLSDNGLSYSTVKKAYEAVNQCFRQYRIKTTSSYNPCEGIALPTNTRQNTADILFFNEEQRELIKQEAIRTYSNGKSVYRLGYSIILIMYTGMRIGELLALTWNDIDFDDGTITINKNAVVVKDENGNYKLVNQKSTKTASSCRVIPMTKMARTSLVELLKVTGNCDYVMSTRNNHQVSPRNINRMFHNILKQTGISQEYGAQCGVHTLRHTFASMLFGNGCSVKVVSDILGHSDTKITENIYIHLIQEQKVKAILDIDKYSN